VISDEKEGRNPEEALRKIDAAGNEVTSYAVRPGTLPNRGVEVTDGGIVTYGSNDLQKFDSSGNEVSGFRANIDDDALFNENSNQVSVMVATSDGGVVVAGTQTSDRNRLVPVFVKLDSLGVPDTSFKNNQGGFAKTEGGICFMHQLADGSLLVASGYLREFDGGLKKFSSAGVEDTAFTTNVSDALQGYTPTALDVLPNGTVVVAVSDFAGENLLWTFDSAGNEIFWDEEAGSIEEEIIFLQHTAQNHVIFGGSGQLRELDSNGDAVDSFVSEISSSFEEVTAVSVTTDGHLLVAGDYPTVMKKYFLSDPAPTVSAVSPATGLIAGGTSITITGTNFAAGASLGVSVGGVAATSVRVVSATKITAKTPAHAAGVANIVVTNGDGQTGTLSRAFTFTVPADPPPVTVLTGAAAKNAKVVTVASKVSGDFRAAPSINVVVAVGVIPSVKGLPKNSSIKVEVSATFQNRPTTNYQTIGTLRSDANGNLKVTAFKASRAGSLNIRFKTSAGKNYYLKVQVTAR
jgi:hypothetical protein